MKLSWLLLLLCVTAQVILTRKLAVWVDQQPSDYFGAGIEFWLAIALFVIVDVIWLGINIVKSC